MHYLLHLKHALSITLIIGLLSACNSEKNNPEKPKREDTTVKIEQLLEKAKAYIEKGKHEEGQQVYDEANKLVTSETDTTTRIKLLLNQTELLKRQGNYEICIQNYYKACELAKQSGDSLRLALGYYNLSTTFYLLKNNIEAKKYNLMAQRLYENSSEAIRLANCYVLYSSICRINSDFSEAKEGLQKAITIYTEKGDEKNLAICFNNFGNILIEEGKLNDAIKYHLKALEMSKKTGDRYSFAIRLGNVGEIYLLKNQLKKAEKYIDSSLAVAKQLGAQETILNNLERKVEFYKKKGDLPKALEASEEFIVLKTKLLKLESSSLIGSAEDKHKRELRYIKAKNKLKLLERNNLLKEQRLENTRIKLYFLSILSVIIIGVSFIIYKKQKRIRVKENQLHQKEQEVLIAKNNIALIEREQLSKELDFKRKELLTFSMSLHERENFLKKLKAIFLRIQPNSIPDQKVLDELKQQLYSINRDQSAEIQTRIEKINSSFLFNLKSNYPHLTDDDTRLASLLLLDLSAKEISTILHIEVKSVNMKCYRLKKKLNLDQNTDLRDFLAAI